MVGQYVMRQSDCEHPPEKLPDAVGIGTYSLDSHLCQRVAQQGMVVAEGGFMDRIRGAYPIRYRALVPGEQECEKLIVTFCVSATHVCFASIRMEPPLMVVSESAAMAAHSALEENTTVQGINLERFARRLKDAGQIVMPAAIPGRLRD